MYLASQHHGRRRRVASDEENCLCAFGIIVIIAIPVFLIVGYTMCQDRCKETETTCNITTVTKRVPQFDGFPDGPYINRSMHVIAPTLDFMGRPTSMTFVMWQGSLPKYPDGIHPCYYQPETWPQPLLECDCVLRV